MDSKQEWNGEGLPPVGTVCEVVSVHSEDNWKETTITHRGGSLSVGALDGIEVVFRHAYYRFRPIRPELSERDKAVEDMRKVVDSTDNRTRGLELLYDAGYRKVNDLTDEDIESKALGASYNSTTPIRFREGARWARDFIMGEVK